ncbi:hypothetical protein EV385_3140 [Krasilnikovia cinnamomea]|uniref:Uncharacterized protein n=1 Tax=Krasilnikovia cinnamomea TaxID=349313 RepID=A0A4Q7ZLW2_9ACTN|nr:hypothetical protein [Krasilnikovia cinnamomea]RZU51325.1 hypothetical protein EV385_3140 [Krasilnikovia cinnamomea]
MTIPPVRQKLAAATAACLFLLGATVGCDKGSDDVQTRNADDVAREVQQYADQVVTIIGDTKLTNGVVDTSPCEGKRGETDGDIRTTYGIYQLPVSDHAAAIGRLRQAWNAAGWRITDDRTVGQRGEGVLAAEAPNGGLNASITSTTPPTHVKLSIYSACYQTAKAG